MFERKRRVLMVCAKAFGLGSSLNRLYHIISTTEILKYSVFEFKLSTHNNSNNNNRSLIVNTYMLDEYYTSSSSLNCFTWAHRACLRVKLLLKSNQNKTSKVGTRCP